MKQIKQAIVGALVSVARLVTIALFAVADFLPACGVVRRESAARTPNRTGSRDRLAPTTRLRPASALILLTVPLFLLAGQPAHATTENVNAMNAAFEQLARSAIQSQIGGGGPVCAPSETASRPLRGNDVGWLIHFKCNRKEDSRTHSISVQAKIRTYTYGHETMSIRNSKDFMVEKLDDDHPVDHKQTEWVDKPAYTARIKKRWIRWNLDRKNDRSTAGVTAEAKQAFAGIRPDGDFRSDDDALAVRVYVSVEVSHDDIDALQPSPGEAAIAIVEHILAGLSGTEKPEVAFLDANPIYSRDGQTDPREWRPSDLIRAARERDGVATDGQSRLILRATMAAPQNVRFELAGDMPGALEPLLGGDTVEFDGKHYAFALYRAPERFDNASAANAPTSMMRPPAQRLGDVLQVRHVKVRILPEQGGEPMTERELVLARPPVILVHGLFSDPITTWVDTFEDQPSMVKTLETAGFLPFLVNYQKTNGMWDTGATGTADGSWLSGSLPDSTFAANRRVVWESPLDTHTRVEYDTGWFTEKPIQAEQQVPGTIRIGGIRKALEYYRDELKIAATQATVIGHSMGGLLARVWASENYNPDYRAARNFMAGDIYRLMTLNTPHHGSEVPELRDALADATIDGEPWLAWARRQLVNTGLNWLLDPEPGAISDLRPGSRALKRIGPTRIPGLAIATTADPGQYGDAQFDPFSLYNSLYALSGTLFFQNRPLLDRFVRNRFYRWRNTAEPFRRETDWRGQSPVLEGGEVDLATFSSIIGETMDDTAYFWALRRDAEFEQELRRTLKEVVEIPFGLMRSQMGNADDLELIAPASLASRTVAGADLLRFYDESKTDDVPRAFMALLHDLVFYNDARTDGVVKLSSQTGGAAEHEPVPSVLHSYSPWHYAVQSRVIRALKWQPELFDPEGFPEAGQLTPRFLPGRQFTAARVTGERAINWSGMVPAHARQYLTIADKEDAVVLVRPVNADSTRLLAENAAAKGMNVKGKSSNWGPQSGYIPVNQRYSKLWRMFREPTRRNNIIEKYDEQVEKSLTTEHPEFQGLTYAVARPLSVRIHTGESCDVLNDPSGKDAEDAVILKCGSTYYDWRNAQKGGMASFDPARPVSEIAPSPDTIARLEPLMVLADPTQDHQPYLTADYDLLAIGFRDYDGTHGPPESIRTAGFHKVRGVITDRQWRLVDRINRAVQEQACYDSGQVTHHGPENQYPGSPYVDYPILVFDPRTNEDKTDGIAYLVRQGPPGFRDLHLKRLFADKIGEGFDLWPNPVSKGWQWEKRRDFDEERGYDPRDSGDLLVYVSEAPEPPARDFTTYEADCAGTAQVADREQAGEGSARQAEAVPEKEGGAGDPGAPQQSDTPEPKALTAQASPPLASETEMAIWNDVKDSGSVEELGYYLELFPEGVFAPLAKIRLRRLEGNGSKAPSGPGAESAGETPPPPPPTEALERFYSSIDGFWTKIVAHPKGGYLVAGAAGITSRKEFGRPWIGQLSRAGDIQWQKAVGSGILGFVTGLQRLASGDLLVSWTEQRSGDGNDITYAAGRFDSSGNRIWSVALGELDDGFARSVFFARDNGDVVVAGPFGGSGNDAPGQVVGLSGEGEILWRTSNLGNQNEGISWIGGSGSEILVISNFRKNGDSRRSSGRQLAVLSANGKLRRHVILDTGSKPIDITAAELSPDGDFFVLGSDSTYGENGRSRTVLTRFDPSGRMRWRDERWPERYTYASGMDVLPDGSLFLFAFLTEDFDNLDYNVWIARYGADGELLNQSSLGEVGFSDIFSGAVPLHDGGIAIVGSQRTESDDDFKIQPWLLVLPPPDAETGNWSFPDHSRRTEHDESPPETGPEVKLVELQGAIGDVYDQNATARICRRSGLCLPADGADIETGDSIEAPDLIIVDIEDPDGFSRHGLKGRVTNARPVRLDDGTRAVEMTLASGLMQGTIRGLHHLIRFADGYCLAVRSDYMAEAKAQHGTFRIEKGSALCHDGKRAVRLDSGNPSLRW